MKKTIIKLFAFALLVCVACSACVNDKPADTKPTTAVPKPTPVEIPIFSGDSAYAYVQKQVDFGPRVPNTKAHTNCSAWLSAEFKRLGFTVIEQDFKANHYTGTTFTCKNIIAQYRPDLPKRVLIAAHWDSRFHADKDTKDKKNPIAGADDGASGVGVQLAMAQILQNNPVEIGVDFILFDAEDQGNDSDDPNANTGETWCLGSQYWAKNVHKPGYSPYYAILLDMVGGNEAKFFKEGVSMNYAAATVEKVWSLAASMGYGDLFINQTSEGVTDDHYFVIRDARIPMIDIISTPDVGEKRFPSYHHTHQDDMAIISKETLRKVGQVMTAFVYRVHNETI